MARQAGSERSGAPPVWLVDGLTAVAAGVSRGPAPLLLAGAFPADVLASGAGIARWLYAAAGVVAAAGLVGAVRRARRERTRAVGLLRPLVHAGVLALVLSGPAARAARELDFLVNESRRTGIARRIETGWRPARVELGRGAACGGGFTLAGAERLLAADGVILVSHGDDGASVFFFREFGWFGDGAGYLYRGNGTPPPDRLFGCSGTVGIDAGTARRLSERWFWAEFTGID